MKHISILVPEGAILGSIEGPHKVLTEVNNFYTMAGQPPVFQIDLVGMTEATHLNDGLFTVSPSKLLSDIQTTDLVIVPAVHGDLQQALQVNQAFVPWIVEQHKRGAEIASLCIGAFILASTGLLDGRKCATHWIAANHFRMMFPQVELVPERIITDERGIYSSGGAYSYLNLILYLIEKYAGREAAVYCAKVYAIEIGRENQSQFMIFQSQKDHDDDAIRKAQSFIEANYQQRITVDQLASLLAMGRRNLERRFKKATNNTVIEYIQRVKIEAAKARLESSRDNVNEVMYHVGYADPKAFRMVFKHITGLSPIQYRSKYNRTWAAS